MTTKQISIQKKAAFVLIISGAVLFALPLQGRSLMPMTFTAVLIFSTTGAVLVAIGSRLHYRARQYTAKNLAEKFATQSSDHHLLFLRPFSADSSLKKTLKGPNTVSVMQNLQATL